MRFKGKVAPWWYAVIVFFNVITIGLFVAEGWNRTTMMYLPLLLVVELYTIPVLFRNYVEVNKEFVTVYFGLLTKTIPTKEITAVKEMTSYKASFSASFDRIVIESQRMDLVCISIYEKKEFFKELLKANRTIKYIM